MSELQAQLNDRKVHAENMVRFLNTMIKYVDLETLDRGILNEVIDRIVVHTEEGKNPNRTQRLDIHYRFGTETDQADIYSSL